MSIDGIIQIYFTAALVELMVAIGLGVEIGEISAVARNRSLVARAVLANYVCVPAAAVGLLLVYQAEPMVAAGFLIVAVCPGAPYGPPFASMARGNVGAAVGLMVILAASSAIVAPLLLRLLLFWMSAGESLEIDLAMMVTILLGAQLLPLCLGLGVRRWLPDLAVRLKRPADRLGVVLNVSGVVGLLILRIRMLAEIRVAGFAGMLVLVLAALVAGRLLGGTQEAERKTMAMVTSVRNVGVGLVIAADSFPGTAAIIAVTAFAIFQTVVLALVAVGWGRWASVPGAAVG